MKRFKILGVLVIAAFMLSAVASSVSSAAMTLPEFTVQTNGTTTSPEGELFGAAEIKCKKDKGSTTATSKKGGTFTLKFEECTGLGAECHGLGDTAGVISTGGNYQLVLDTLGTTDSHLILFEPKEVHIECKFLSTLVLVKGNVLGTITPAGVKTKAFTVSVLAKGKKEQEFKEYENDAGTKVNAHLESATDEGAFEESGENAGKATLTTEKETDIIN